MLLTLSDVERGIYDNCISDLEKRQLCCHLQVVRRLQEVVGPQLMTLDEVKVVMISHTKQVGYDSLGVTAHNDNFKLAITY